MIKQEATSTLAAKGRRLRAWLAFTLTNSVRIQYALYWETYCCIWRGTANEIVIRCNAFPTEFAMADTPAITDGTSKRRPIFP